MKKNRYIHIYTNENNQFIKDCKKIYNDNLYEFHKRYIKMKIFIDEKLKKNKINLIGFDGKVKKIYNKIIPKKIFNDIEKMPMGNIKRKDKKNLSLYADYKPKTTIKGLGFKNEEKAKFTINTIKDLDYRYQVNVLNTMINRAKYHPHKTTDMDKACELLSKYLVKLKKLNNK